MDQPSKQRKRDAVGNLRDLAVDIRVDVAGRRKADLAESEFVALHQEVLVQASTPEHRQRAAEALRLYRGPLLPPVPKLPSHSAPSGAAGASSSGLPLVAQAVEDTTPRPNHPARPT